MAIISAGIVGGLYVFNSSTESYNQYIVGNLIALLWVPMLSILMFFCEEPSKYGFTLGSSKKVWPVVSAAFVALLIMMFFAAGKPVFQNYYPIFRRYPEFEAVFASYPRENPFTYAPMQMLYALASYGMYLFCWEFFFRGYMLFGLHRSIGWWAILIQAAAFCVLHISKPLPEVIASFGAGVILGIIALNAKSFVPCFVLHWAGSMAFDFMVVMKR